MRNSIKIENLSSSKIQNRKNNNQAYQPVSKVTIKTISFLNSSWNVKMWPNVKTLNNSQQKRQHNKILSKPKSAHMKNLSTLFKLSGSTNSADVNLNSYKNSNSITLSPQKPIYERQIQRDSQNKLDSFAFIEPGYKNKIFILNSQPQSSFLLSPENCQKTNNYNSKNFPKRELRLRNNNPLHKYGYRVRSQTQDSEIYIRVKRDPNNTYRVSTARVNSLDKINSLKGGQKRIFSSRDKNVQKNTGLTPWNSAQTRQQLKEDQTLLQNANKI